MKRALLMIAMGLALIPACATRAPFSHTECNREAGYDRGFTEGRKGMDPSTEYSFQCREDLRAAVREGYRAGHEKGRAEFKEMVAQQQQMAAGQADPKLSGAHDSHSHGRVVAAPPQPRYLCEITHAGRGFQAVSTEMHKAREETIRQCDEVFSRKICSTMVACKLETAAATKAGSRAFYCQLEVFTDAFEAFGATETETRSQVRKLCAAKRGDAFFCNSDEIECRPNR